MKRLLMVCHGNICRSTMAEFVMQDLIARRGLQDRLAVDSAATSREEIGNPPHRGTRQVLRKHGVPCGDHRARQMTRDDYERYDLMIGMDRANVSNMCRCWNGDPLGKVHKLLEYTGSAQDVSDPWYSGDFDTAYDDISRGCSALMTFMLKDRA